MTDEELGKRFRRVMTQLKEMGVGYRENYGGPFETVFPHSVYTFKIIVDRGSRPVHCELDWDGDAVEFGGHEGETDDMALEVLVALERTKILLEEMECGIDRDKLGEIVK